MCFALIITIPFGIAAFRIAGYALWPFGRTIDRRRTAGLGSLIGNVIWIILFGWWLAIGHLVTGILLCLTIIGIPLGLGNFKLIPIRPGPARGTGRPGEPRLGRPRYSLCRCNTRLYGGPMASVKQFQVTFDCAEPERVGRFWCEVLGYVAPPIPAGFATWDDFDRLAAA